MDVLSDLVDFLRLRGHLYGHLALSAPFALSFPSDVGHFFVLTDGQCWLKVGEDAPQLLCAGDFVFLPSQDPFCLLSADGSTAPAPRPFTDDEGRSYLETGRIDLPGDLESGVRLVSGCFRFGAHETGLLTEHLDGPLRFRTTGRAVSPRMTTIFQMIAEEAQPGRIGAFTIIDRLAEVLLIHALRARLEGNGQAAPGWLAALRDPRIGPTLHDMHFAPQKDWSVEALARSVGMSRSAFAARFRTLVGRTPMDHLTRWRMHKAAHLLTHHEPKPIPEVVAAVGYQSEAAFRRKFTETIGMAPAKYRATRIGAALDHG